MKKVFRPHIILCVGGRIFIFVMISIPLLMLFMFSKFAFLNGTIDIVLIPLVAFALALNVLAIWLVKYFWQQIWGKLIITEKEVIWKCIFCRSVRIRYSEIRHMSIQNFGERNYIKVDMYNTGFKFLLITTCGPISKPIDKIKCGKGVIKWQIFSQEIWNCINKLRKNI